MNDSKTVVEDLAAWLTQIWDEEEAMVQAAIDDDTFEPVAWPCPTIRLLASPYADRPGFRPEWSVERQGVEW